MTSRPASGGDGLGTRKTDSADNRLLQALIAEHFAFGILRFRDAIGDHQEAIAWLQLAVRAAICRHWQ